MSRVNPTLVGAFVVGAVALAIAAAVALGVQGTSGRTQAFVVQLEGTVNGLRVGAPVKFKGIEIGAVERINIRVPTAAGDVPIAVVCRIYEEKLDAASVGARRALPTVAELVTAGLRARLATESIVTGILYIALTFDCNVPGTRHGDLDGLPEVPALPSASEQLEAGLQGVLEKLQTLDLAGLVGEAKSAARSIGELGSSPGIRASLQSLDETLASLKNVAAALERDATPLLASTRQVIDHLDAALGPFTSSVSAAANDVGTAAGNLSGTLGALDGSTNPNAPLIVELQSALVEIAGAARAARSLLEQLDRDPSQLLRGRAIEAGASR